MPTIAVTHCRKLDDYTQAVIRSGSRVRVVGPPASAADALAGVDGLLLTGGDDVAPSRYGEERHASVVEVAPERDEFEIALIHEARARQLPLLAICRGLQVLNVACGGALVQDIPSQVAGALAHEATVAGEPCHIGHEISIEPHSLLSTLVGAHAAGTNACEVNSRHHQAVKTIAPGFRVVATAPDGVVEAIEDPRARFCLGVQWHPENFWRSGEFSALFEELARAAVDASSRRS